ncbi:hypothetical protein L6452_02546 [Arctium lappa]|uniref:Uncharacterized protein n=1 Tax=Arctium lappa TaxID=4217 RepID=A0ACB9FJ47_ARCLA|nr:hypothetical protein L6452_02546 [Arctium lappa]
MTYVYQNMDMSSIQQFCVPIDDSFDQDNLLDEDEVIEVKLDDGDIAQFITHDSMPTQADPMTTLESEMIDSTASLVSS